MCARILSNMHDSASTDGASKCAEMSNFQFKVDAHTLEVALSICHRLMLGKWHSFFATGGLPDLPSKDPMNRCKPVCFQEKYARVTAVCCLSLALKFCQVHLFRPRNCVHGLWRWSRKASLAKRGLIFRYVPSPFIYSLRRSPH
jgi:hypothetical protein